MHPEIEKLIEIASKGEAVTDRQREIIRHKASSLGEDPEEAELLLDLSFKRERNKSSLTDTINQDNYHEFHYSPKVIETEDGRSVQGDDIKKIIYGVCAGLANRFKLDVRILRLILLVLELVILFLSFNFYITIWWSFLIPLAYFILGRVFPSSQA